MKLWNSNLNTESKKHREMRLAGLLPKKTYKIAHTSKKMKKRVINWRKTAKENCTVNGVLICPMCGSLITGQWVAHHYKERRGQSHSVENDKFVAALHPWCHNNIDHYSDDFYIARNKIETILKKWGKL